MVLEALAAIGLAGNIVQFVAFGASLLSETREIIHSASDLNEEELDLQIVSQDIETITDRLKADTSRDPNLVSLSKQCVVLARKLLSAIQAIEKLDSTPKRLPGKRKKWPSFRIALRRVWAKPTILNMESRLNALRDQVIFHLTACNDDKQTRMMHLIEELKEDNKRSGYEATSSIRELASRLQHIQEIIPTMNNEPKWATLEEEITQWSVEMTTVSRRHMIIKSLDFDSMRVRHAAITDAYRETFSWIFKPDSLPSDDPRSEIEFKTWLRQGDGIYWVTGKPGSGNSTLMKYINDHEVTSQCLDEWAGDGPLVRASFYFWNPGTAMQKSLSGLLQSLLYHILGTAPELIPTLCPGKWETSQHLHVSPLPLWSRTELRTALASLNKLEALTTKFYFHVDGLDEFDGDHWEVIEILQNLAACPNIKLCLSSRPWNCFQDAFGRAGTRMLRLHDLTAQDIELFVRKTLFPPVIGDRIFDGTTFEDLIHDIVTRAQGVFLWVRLVLRSLRDGLCNDDPISILQKRLHLLPTDLEPFFEHILQSVETVYQGRMARSFLCALQAKEPLDVIHYWFLEEEDLAFAFQLPFQALPEREVDNRLHQTLRRLNGRYKGLLESSTLTKLDRHSKVDFLHRTLRDFLLTGRMQELLRSRVKTDFNPSWAISQAHLAVAKLATPTPGPECFAPAIEEASREAEQSGDATYEFRMIDHVEIACGQNWPSRYLFDNKELMIKVALHIGRIDYVRHRLCEAAPITSLDYFLRHSLQCEVRKSSFASILRSRNLAMASSNPTNYCPSIQPRDTFFNGLGQNLEMTRLWLSQGANPNSSPIWDTFLEVMFRQLKYETAGIWVELFELLIAHGARVQDSLKRGFDLTQPSYRTSEKKSTVILHLFKILFDRGLNPSAELHGVSLWNTLLSLSYDWYSTDTSNYRQDLLRLFLRQGCNPGVICLENEPNSWLFDFTCMVKSSDAIDYSSLYFSDFMIFLEHGLDPNMLTPDGRTLLSRIFQAMVESKFFLRSIDRARARSISHFLLQCLRYGADPTCEFLGRLASEIEVIDAFSATEKTKIRAAVDKEKNFVESREKFLSTSSTMSRSYHDQRRPSPGSASNSRPNIGQNSAQKILHSTRVRHKRKGPDQGILDSGRTSMKRHRN